MTTITLPRAVVEQALEALTVAWQQNPRWQITDGMHALRAALAQQAEPGAWGRRREMNKENIIRMAREACETTNWKPGLGNEHVVEFMTRFAAIAAAAGADAALEAEVTGLGRNRSNDER